ncbi:MAG: DNA adenine methylase [Selenomonadaceae bacterium]|nr:DNA adenine methylase [Selenomonadaceae bacterium]MBP3722150.1 DNA adenine methylase [Selenomonadaceae bacterium]
MSDKKMTPVLKWAGGKTQLLEQIKENMPTEYNRYYEPFIGGAAVLFGVLPLQAFINDVNEQLINLYTQLKNAVETVIEKINEMDAIPCDKELYYALREKYNHKISNRAFDEECAALMIWINKHCFNGLYRVNSKGLFNVPYNNKVNGKSINEENLIFISDYLRKTDIKITCLDFEKACENVEKGDFVYFDSPYVPKSTTASFTDYTMRGFTLNDHERLSALFKHLDKIGAKVMLSNNDVPLVRELYVGYKIQSVDVKRMINCNAKKRTEKEEGLAA